MLNFFRALDADAVRPPRSNPRHRRTVSGVAQRTALCRGTHSTASCRGWAKASHGGTLGAASLPPAAESLWLEPGLHGGAFGTAPCPLLSLCRCVWSPH
eukprot:1197070-Prymnesium_polylepis.1